MPAGKYERSAEYLAACRAPWTCPTCGKVLKANGKGGHKAMCGRDYVPVFWSKVEKTAGCWLWKGALKHTKYGHFRESRLIGQGTAKTILAHRYSWELAYGPAPAEMDVLHRCDVRHCVNPAHLYVGTHKDNMRDKVARGRQIRGEQSSHAKLSEAQAREILALKGRAEAKELAEKYGVGNGAISAIWRGDAWSHLSEAPVS